MLPGMPGVDPQDEHHMRRAIRLAMNGRGRVEPNPMVGCVLVRNGQVIGEGYHGRFGGPHAEPAALDDCYRQGLSPAGATAYVTLEPCCHTNKKTPPCTPRLIGARVARVVIACPDPNPSVNGRGAEMLREAGIQVVTGVCGTEGLSLIEPFLLSQTADRPYVTMKWAETADGKVAGHAGQRLQISGPDSRRLVHEVRSRVDAIVVGVSTVLVDDPLLDARYAGTPKHPHRYVLDSRLRTPLTSRIIIEDPGRTTLLYAYGDDTSIRSRRDQLEAAGVTTVMLAADAKGQVDLRAALRHLKGQPMTSEVLVEPGPILAASFFEAGLVDRLWVFRSPTRVANPTAPAAATISENLKVSGSIRVGDDELTEYRRPRVNRETNEDCSVTPSVDLLLASQRDFGTLQTPV